MILSFKWIFACSVWNREVGGESIETTKLCKNEEICGKQIWMNLSNKCQWLLLSNSNECIALPMNPKIRE